MNLCSDNRIPTSKEVIVVPVNPAELERLAADYTAVTGTTIAVRLRPKEKHGFG